jgi:diguanylate cyclase (GGDEF)-like protein
LKRLEWLKRLRPAPAALALLAAVLATGSSVSPLLPVLVAGLIALVRFVDARWTLLAPLLAAAALVLVDRALADFGWRTAMTAVAVAASAYPGLLWRREARRAASRLAQLDDILDTARRDRSGEAPSAADELADLERALARVAQRIGARSLLLWDVDASRGIARPRAGSAGRPVVSVRLAGDPLGWAWQEDMRLRMEQTPRWADAGLQVTAEPLRRQEQGGELLTCAFEPGRLPHDDAPFDEAAIYLRGVLALQTANAVAAASERRLNALVNGLRRMPGELELASLAADLCSTAAALTGATGATIATWDGEEGEILAVVGDDGGPRPGTRFVPPASELALAIRADAMLVREAGQWRLGRTAVANEREQWQVRPRAMAALPLHLNNAVTGVLAVWTTRRPALEPKALNLLHALSPFAALHLDHARAFDRMRDSAERDALTGLYNRRAFDRLFGAEAVRFERYGRPLCLFILDLDHFKAINDTVGHEAGDEVLRRAARTAAACIRETDMAARFGGEEFVVLLPETGLDAALKVAERIRSAIGGAPMTWRGSPVPVTVSIGVASCPEHVTLPAALLAAADAALYRAKASGRNLVVAAEGAPAAGNIDQTP